MEAEFQAQHPDYSEAYKYLEDISTKYIKGTYGVDDTGAKQAILREQMNLTANALQQGRNPAEVVYEMAKGLGWENNNNDVPLVNNRPTRQAPVSLSGSPARGKARFNLAALADEDPETFNQIATNPDKWEEYMIRMGHPQ